MSEGCTTCGSLMSEVEIKSPGQLQRVAESVAPYVRDGALEQQAGTGTLDEVAKGRWEDFVSARFRCTSCGRIYELVAETYHGAGGHLRRVDDAGA